MKRENTAYAAIKAIRAKRGIEHFAMSFAFAIIALAVLYIMGVIRSSWLLWAIIGIGAAMNILVGVIGLMSDMWIISTAAFLLAAGAAGMLYYLMLF